MKNNAEELIDIITKAVEIIQYEDDEQLFFNTLDEATKFTINFLQEDWIDLITKLPFKWHKQRDCESMVTMDYGVLYVAIKNAPDEILTAIIQKMLKMIEKDARDYLFSLIYSTQNIVKRFTNDKVKSRLRKLCDKRISSSAIKDEKMREEELEFLKKFKQEF